MIHEIRLHLPGKPLLLVVIFGTLLALLGTLLMLPSSGPRVQFFAGIFVLGLAGIVFGYVAWLWRNPVFMANAEGIQTRYLALHVRVTWEEIATLSASGGLLIRKRPGTSEPQEILVLQGSLPFSAERLLLQLQQQFHTQIVHHRICIQSPAESE